MEVNVRSVYAMRCGVGHRQGLQKCCGIMNMPPPVARKNDDNISSKHGEAVEVAKASMIQAAVEIKERRKSDIGVSFDGTWQRRGYSSLNGVRAAISITSGNVLDCEILSRYCKNCALHVPLK